MGEGGGSRRLHCRPEGPLLLSSRPQETAATDSTAQRRRGKRVKVAGERRGGRKLSSSLQRRAAKRFITELEREEEGNNTPQHSRLPRPIPLTAGGHGHLEPSPQFCRPPSSPSIKEGKKLGRRSREATGDGRRDDGAHCKVYTGRDLTICLIRFYQKLLCILMPSS